MKFPNNSNWKWNIQKVINNPIKIWKNDDRVDVIGGWQASRSTSLFLFKCHGETIRFVLWE